MQELQQALRDRSSLREQLSSAQAAADAGIADLDLTVRQLHCATEELHELHSRVDALEYERHELLAGLQACQAQERHTHAYAQQLQQELECLTPKSETASTRSDCAFSYELSTLRERGAHVGLQLQRSAQERIALLQGEVEHALAAAQAASSKSDQAAQQLQACEEQSAARVRTAQAELAAARGELCDVKIVAESEAAQAATALRMRERQVAVLQQEVQRMRCKHSKSSRVSDRGVGQSPGTCCQTIASGTILQKPEAH